MCLPGPIQSEQSSANLWHRASTILGIFLYKTPTTTWLGQYGHVSTCILSTMVPISTDIGIECLWPGRWHVGDFSLSWPANAKEVAHFRRDPGRSFAIVRSVPILHRHGDLCSQEREKSAECGSCSGRQCVRTLQLGVARVVSYLTSS